MYLLYWNQVKPPRKKIINISIVLLRQDPLEHKETGTRLIKKSFLGLIRRWTMSNL